MRRAVRNPTSASMTLPDGRVVTARVWRGRGTPIVLLHGLLDCADGWAELCRSTTRPCVAIDLPGFGGSDLPTRPAFSAYAEDVLQALDVLAPGPMVLVGHSLGGAIATAVAERAPDRVCALVLLAPAGFGRIPLAEAISVPGVRIVADRLLPFVLGRRIAVEGAYRWFVANGLAPDDDLLERVAAQRVTSAAGAVEATKAVVRGGLSARAFHRRTVDFGGPVAVVWGDCDRVVPISHMAGVAAALPHVETHVWRGMGHHPQSERPRELAALVEASCEAVQRPRPLRLSRAA